MIWCVTFHIEKRKRNKELDWDNEIQRDLMLQQQARRELKTANTAEKVRSYLSVLVLIKAMEDSTKYKTIQANVNITPIKAGESLKKFEKRVREETKKVSNSN